MKNVTDSMKKTCIFLTEEDFGSLLDELFPDSDTEVDVSFDGLMVTIDECSVSTSDKDSILIKKLTEHFDVNQVTSIHTDVADVDYPIGIWICYK